MAETPPEQTKTMRADARRNREKLIAAAKDLFAEAGTDVPLDAVARRAGVGPGTLYRHFPTRDALVEAAYRSEVAHLADAAEELLATRPPDVALAEWMDHFVAYAAAKRGMRAALQSVVASGSTLFADARRQNLATIERLLEAGAEAGTIRPDVEAEDVLRATGVVWQFDDQPGWDEQARRVLRLVMDGLRYGASR
jgi:AcrR family transcriptional regulator